MKMASSFTFNPLHRKHLFSILPCKYPSSFSCFKSPYFISDSYTIPSQNHTLSLGRNQMEAKMMASLEHKIATEVTDSAIPGELGSGFSSLRSKQQRVQQKTEHSSVMEEKMGRKYRRDGVKRKDLELRGGKRDMGSGFSSSLMSVDEKVEIQVAKKAGEISSVVNERLTRSGKKNKGSNQEVGVVKMNQMSNGKGNLNLVGEKTKSSTKKNKLESPGVKFRIGLDMCSKHGDVLTAISLYESAQREGIKMEQYHYNVLLYLCSSAAAGIVSPAKTGNVSRTLNKMNIVSGVSSFSSIDASKIKVLVESTRSDELSSSDKIELNSNGIVSSSVKSKDMSSRFVNGLMTSGNNKDESVEGKRVNDDVKTYALIMGFKIYDKMCLEKIPLSEATLTSVARMAMAIGDGDMAFEMVKKMKELGITQRLRSYGPALFTFCRKGEIEKAFEVEEHMLQSGVSPEEPELEELLRVSVENGKHGKVYYILQKLRTSVRQVSPSTADLIERWFKSKAATSVGKRQWDQRLIMKAMENGGGGWHGQGWLGKGKWTVTKTCVKNNGVCDGCGIKLTTIDLDPVETENFAKSVASIAQKREKSSSFQNFQKWLDSYGPYEAVVDAANVGLFHQKEFSLPKVNAIVEGIRQKLPSKKIPLIVVHNKRILEDKMGKPAKMLIEKWNKANALYSTPTGSNDDWYWLYAAIKFKCLLVTNDEMRDHLFQLLGNDFFPRWKERHQVRFTFNDDGPEVHMPPSCSVVIQESEKGHWHVPIASEHDLERERTWLCITRNAERDSSTRPKGARSREKESEAQSKAKRKTKLPQSDHGTG